MPSILKDVNFLTLFLEGLLSVFSPCVLPIIPLYLGYLGQEDSSTPKIKRMLKMFCFILGISLTFIILGFGSSLLSDVFSKNQVLFKIFGGIILILFALVSLNVISIPILERLNFRDKLKLSSNLSFFQAFLMGFSFSFAFTPCVGPMLAQALLMAAQAESKATGRLYILAYFAGFILLFVLLGIFTTQVLDFIKKRKNIVKYTSILAGILILLSGLYMVYTGVKDINSLQSVASSQPSITENNAASDKAETEAPNIKTVGYTLEDLEGNVYKLEDMVNKPTVLYFAQTWCGYCAQETPVLNTLKEEYGDSLEIIMIDNLLGEYGASKQDVWDFFQEQSDLKLKLLFDTAGGSSTIFGVSGYPTIFFINADGTVLGYVPGYLDETRLREVVNQLVKGE